MVTSTYLDIPRHKWGLIINTLYYSWNWDRETLLKANGCYHTCCSFQFLVSLTVTMKILSVIKPISVKLQRKSNDIVKAYNMISETEKELKEMRDNADVVFKRWYEYAVEISSDLGTEPSAPRTASRQQHRANAPNDTPEEYYRRSLSVHSLTISHKRCLRGNPYILICALH